MQIWPAIDLRDGSCVRLEQGNYDRQTVFSQDPIDVAKRFEADGASGLHLVDLDGARSGVLAHAEVIGRIVDSVGMVCEVGGGVRDRTTIQQLVDIGVQRIVIGTKAITDPEWFASMSREFPQTLVLGLDAKSGRVATDGWEQQSDHEPVSVAQQYEHLALAAIIYTDIATDGMMSGPNLAAMSEMQAAVQLPVVASGGVASAADIQALAAIPMDGVIVGRALYEGAVSMADALEAGRPVNS